MATSEVFDSLNNRNARFAVQYDDVTQRSTLEVIVVGGQDVTIDGSNLVGVSMKDDGPSWVTVRGIAGVPFTSADQHSAAASVTDAPTSGQFIVIDDVIISVDTTMNVTLKCETSGAVLMGPFYMLANTTLAIQTRGKGKKTATADKKVQVITSVSGHVMVDLGYHSEA